MSDILITICARGGSKGIPGKNIKELNGKPLLHYTLQLALEFASKYKADIQLSTDSDEILACAKILNYQTNYKRSSDLASDSAGKIGAIKAALVYSEQTYGKEYQYIIDLDVTSPLRTINDLNSALKQLFLNQKALNIFSVNPSSRNPYYNMVEKNDNGFVKVVKDAKIFKSRQEVPEVFDMNASFYIFRKAFFTQGFEVSTIPFSLAYVMDHICFDLDHPIDFTVMDLMIKNNLLSDII